MYLEKYVEFYKWIDSAVGHMLQELYPASANASDTDATKKNPVTAKKEAATI